MTVRPANFYKDIRIHRLGRTGFVLNRFECRKQQYADYLREGAFDDQAKKVGQTWLFVYKKECVIGYITIAMAHLSRREHGKLESFPHSNVPGLLVGQIATHRNFEGLGIGKAMIDWAAAQAKEYQEDMGCRLIIVNPDKDVVGWYEKIGFVRIRHERKQDMMFIDLDWV